MNQYLSQGVRNSFNNNNFGEDTTASSSTAPNDNETVKQLWVNTDRLGNVCFLCLWSGCQQRFESVDKLEMHIDQHLTEQYENRSLDYNSAQNKSIVCQVEGCQILVTSAEELMRHMKMHIFHAIRLNTGMLAVRERCPNIKNCNFLATSRLVYQGDPLICEWNSCFESFVDINEFVAHLEQHIHLLCPDNRMEQDHYQCLWTECLASFKNKAHLKLHIQHHSGDKTCACPFCGAFFSNITRLVEHIMRRQEGNSSLLCHLCQKTFTSESILRKHCKRHISSHKCQYCSLVLRAPYDLNRHIQTVHAKVRNHVCEHCGKAYYQRSDLNKHVELHFNDTMHECGECGQKFRWSKQLREHERKEHTKDYNPTPYQCHLCNANFPRGSALSKHLTTLHKLSAPPGFTRFQYKKCQDGLFRLQIKRYTLTSAALEVDDEKEERSPQP